MNAPLDLQADRSEAQLRIQRLSERVAQLEGENGFLEAALRRNSGIFDALLSNGRDGIALTGPDRRIVRVVKALTGVNPSSLAGQLIDSLAVPEDRQIVADAYHQLLRERCGRVRIEIRVPWADGNVVLHTATLTDMLDDPNVQGIVWNYSADRAPESDPSSEAVAL